MRQDNGMKCPTCDGDGVCRTCDGDGFCQVCGGEGHLDPTLAEDIVESLTDIERAEFFTELRSSWCLECGRPAPCPDHPEKRP